MRPVSRVNIHFKTLGVTGVVVIDANRVTRVAPSNYNGVIRVTRLLTVGVAGVIMRIS